MNRVILSRKGFDSKYGGRPSPIFKNGDIFSLPIPQNGKSPKKFNELKFNGINGDQALKEVSATKVTSEDFCHYDPALNEKIGLFGQAGSAQSELKNNGVGIGDLFLFFGWFKKKDDPNVNVHKIFGWLQIEEILEGDREISTFLKRNNISHPHDPQYKEYKNNTIYVSKKNFGLFKKYSNDLVLTAPGYSKSMWQFPKKYFGSVANKNGNIFLNRLKWKDKNNLLVDTNIGPGQEFILDAKNSPRISFWAKSLIREFKQ
tara:strand:+ start:712 stop:1491 length:780 start_codon:yes stop_codon:yes gene_type:complete